MPVNPALIEHWRKALANRGCVAVILTGLSKAFDCLPSSLIQTPATKTEIYKGSFFPQTIRDLNALPDSIITSAEWAEDGVARFTSLVRARD